MADSYKKWRSLSPWERFFHRFGLQVPNGTEGFKNYVTCSFLQLLTPEQRKVTELRILQGWTLKTVALNLGLNIGRVTRIEWHIHRRLRLHRWKVDKLIRKFKLKPLY